MKVTSEENKFSYNMAKTNFNLSPIYSSPKPSNHKFPKKHKISPDTTLHIYIYITKHTQNIKYKIFEELVPPVLPLLKKHIRLGYAGIVDHSVDLSIPDIIKKKLKKEV